MSAMGNKNNLKLVVKNWECRDREKKRMYEMDRERERTQILHLNPAVCSSPTPHLHIKLALWLPSLSQGQLSLFLLV